MGKVAGIIDGVGELFALFLDSVVATATSIWRRDFPVGEFVRQSWFIMSVCLVPTILTAIPFGVIVSLQVGGLAGQIGAQTATGAVNVLTTVREASPLITSLLIAGAGGSAICADLGARTVRDEIDAMKVMGVYPVQRLVAPRLLAAMLVAVLLNGIVAFVGIAGGYLYFVFVADGTPGGYLGTFTALTSLPDLVLGEVKAALFGLIAAVVASYKGLSAKGGSKGVGNAVNESVVITFLLLFVVNFVLTSVYFAAVPQRGF